VEIEHRKWFGSRWVRAAASLVVAMGTLTAAQLVAAAPAGAVTGTQVVAGQVSANNSDSPKSARAFCPVGTTIVSGGGWVFVNSRPPDADRAVLSELRPVHTTSSGGVDSFEVSGHEMAPGTSSNWTVQAFAVCAQPVPGLHVVQSARTNGSAPEQRASAFCASNERVLGVGARLLNATGQVALNGVSVGANTEAVAIADEDADGFNANWQLDAFAVCAPAPANWQTIVGSSVPNTSNSDAEKVGFVRCPLPTVALGVGAVVFAPAPGTGLQVLFPGSPLEAAAVESSPTNLNWGPVLVQGICSN
jgi:hypothetical protein